ncbi:mitochondrial import inner membrane translocase subunit TIM16 isoform X1 [Peromyscus californicus insignis]|uniref:mitochondrial import inner membrane translocase subunit TIM16 isoform X1 n=1 Tax=Peromyscus californicus insignis TaxID=564181 RepID=UPI0022A6E654|nr:mitochondrial import inner membrane translocase subunit TIM16 isoform X1 [Peromyscus californicus insignis]
MGLTEKMALDYRFDLEVGGNGALRVPRKELHKQEDSGIKPIFEVPSFLKYSGNLTSIPTLLWLVSYDGFFLNIPVKRCTSPKTTEGLQPPIAPRPVVLLSRSRLRLRSRRRKSHAPGSASPRRRARALRSPLTSDPAAAGERVPLGRDAAPVPLRRSGRHGQVPGPDHRDGCAGGGQSLCPGPEAGVCRRPRGSSGPPRGLSSHQCVHSKPGSR